MTDLLTTGSVLAAFFAGGVALFAPCCIAPRTPAPDTRRGDSASFFALGVFSGVASACCAPVLVGVMALSALSGSALGGVTLGLAYVFGMVFPLLVMALLWDRYNLGQRRFLQARPVTLALPRGRSLHTNSINIGVAVAFTVMGLFVLSLASSGTMTGGPGFQVAIGTGLAGVSKQIEIWTAPVPEPILGTALLGLAAVFIWGTLHRRGTTPEATAEFDWDTDPVSRAVDDDRAGEVPTCHQPPVDTRVATPTTKEPLP